MRRREFLGATLSTTAAMALPTGAMATPGSGNTLDNAGIQALLNRIARELGIVGGQLAIYDGEQVREFQTGYANLERGSVVTADTLFQIGSTTKVYNAATVMSMVDEGLLDLDVPVKKYLPDFKLPDARSEGSVNLRQLMSMSAGIDNGPYTDYGRGEDALEKYVAALADIPILFSPGKGYSYSNACTNISGLAAQRVAGKAWETLLRERIIEPLKLSRTASFAEELLFHPVALGYYREGDAAPQRIPFWGLPRSMAPAGGTLCASAGDLVRFGRMFLNRGQSEDRQQVLSTDSITTMMTPQIAMPNRLMGSHWCVGPFRHDWDGVEVFGHSGTNSGGSSLLLWCPEKNFAVATIANVARQGYPFADKVFHALLPALFGVNKPAKPTVAEARALGASTDVSRYVGRYQSYGNVIELTGDGGRLTMSQLARGAKPEQAIVSELIPMGNDRFLPVNPAVSGNRIWDVAFWGNNSRGQATHFLNGVFASRRVG